MGNPGHVLYKGKEVNYKVDDGRSSVSVEHRARVDLYLKEISDALDRKMEYDPNALERIYEMAWDHGGVKDVFYYHPDHLGSSNWITDESGKPVQYLQYLPYGELWMDIHIVDPTRYTFSGKEKDEETGYSYFGARYYDANLSIWLSVDPMADKYPHQSPYAYCSNNPIGRVDPDGMFDTKAEARKYRRENKTGGRIKENDTGDFSIENKRKGVSYHKDASLADYHGTTIGIDENGVVKSPMITADRDKGPAGNIMKAGMVLVGGATIDPIPGDELIILGGVLITAGAAWVGYELYKQFSPHEKNKSKSKADKHTKTRSGGDPKDGRYGKGRNNNRGDKNKKHIPYPNPNKR